jgi:hypothetical protein
VELSPLASFIILSTSHVISAIFLEFNGRIFSTIRVMTWIRDSTDYCGRDIVATVDAQSDQVCKSRIMDSLQLPQSQGLPQAGTPFINKSCGFTMKLQHEGEIDDPPVGSYRNRTADLTAMYASVLFQSSSWLQVPVDESRAPVLSWTSICFLNSFLVG